MAVYQIDTTIKGVFTPRPVLWLQGIQIDLSFSGTSGYKGRDIMNLDDKLQVQFVGPGLSGQQWEIDLVVTAKAADGTFPPAGSKKVRPFKGEIPAGASSGLNETVAIPVKEAKG